jgi:DNA-binding transcriptional LysR family regulator
MLDLKLVRQAILLAHNRNFIRAAEQLGISQPSLSRNIASLETALKVKLFDRGQDGVTATVFGRLLVAQGEQLLQNADSLEREIKLMRSLEVGDLSLGTGPYPLEISIGPSLGRILEKYPGIKVDMEVLGLPSGREAILSGRLDMVVAEPSGLEDEPKLLIEKLPQHRGVFFCRAGHPLTQKPKPGVEDVFSFPYVGTRLPARIAQAFAHIMPAGRIDKSTGEFIPSVTVKILNTAKEIVVNSNAVSIGIRRQIAKELSGGSLAIVDLHPPWLVTNYGFVYLRTRSLSPAALAFMEEVRSVESELVAAENAMEPG